MVLRHSIPALITAILSFIVFIIVFVYYIKSIAITVEAIQLACAAVSLVEIIDCICKDKASRIYRIIAISLVCIVSGALYKVLYICILGYEAGMVDSISDILWIGFYTVLLYACLRVFEKSADFKDKKYQKIIITSCIVQIIIIGINIAFYTPGDDLLFAIIYGIPSGFLGYYALLYILASFGENSVLKKFRAYNITIVLILIIDNAAYLALIHGLFYAEYILKFCIAMLLLIITPSIYNGVQKSEYIK